MQPTAPTDAHHPPLGCSPTPDPLGAGCPLASLFMQRAWWDVLPCGHRTDWGRGVRQGCPHPRASPPTRPWAAPAPRLPPSAPAALGPTALGIRCRVAGDQAGRELHLLTGNSSSHHQRALCCALLRCSATQRGAAPCSARRDSVMRACSAGKDSECSAGVQCRAVLGCSATQCSAGQCKGAVQSSAVLCRGAVSPGMGVPPWECSSL